MKENNINRSEKGFIKEWRKNKWLFLMLLPGIACLVIFNYIPMAGLLIAFKNINYTKGIWGSDWVGFENFKFFLFSPDALTVTRNTLLYNIAFIGLGLVFAVTVAIALSEMTNKRTMKCYQTVMFLPYFLSWITISYLVYAFLNPDYGFINKVFLKNLGLTGLSWYTQPFYWPFILIGLNLWKFVGYNSVIYFAAITGMNRDYYEAAAIDGATKWQQITKITLPSLTPLMVVMTILAVGRIFNSDFGLFYQTTMDSGPLYRATNVLDTYIYRSLRVTGDLGMSSAAAFFQAVIGFICVMSTNAAVRKIDPEKAMF